MSTEIKDFGLDEAREQFSELLRHLRTDKQRQDFLLWIALEFKGASTGCFSMLCWLIGLTLILIGFMDELNGEKQADVAGKLDEIALELKKRVPPFSVFPSENFVVPQTGEVYGFLYFI
jgi:hypothetical protein